MDKIIYIKLKENKFFYLVTNRILTQKTNEERIPLQRQNNIIENFK